METDAEFQSITAGQREFIVFLGNFATFFSFAAEFYLFFIFFKTWNLWNYSGRMIICLTISCLFYTIANFLTNFNEIGTQSNSSGVCKLDGFLRTFGVLSSFVWSLSIARSAYYKMSDVFYRVNHQTGLLQISKCFGIPFLFALIPLFDFGEAQYNLTYKIHSQCGIFANDKFVSMMWNIGLIFLPSFIGSVLVVRYYYLLMKVSEEYEDSIGISPRKFLLYPFALLVLWLPTALFWMIYQTYGYIFWLDILRVLLSYSLGFLHSIGYIYQGRHIKNNKEQPKAPATELTSVIGRDFTNSFSVSDDPDKSRMSSMASFTYGL